jgi:hypothetical protein
MNAAGFAFFRRNFRHRLKFYLYFGVFWTILQAEYPATPEVLPEVRVENSHSSGIYSGIA